MHVSREFLLQKMPPDMDTWVTLADDQDVKDIIQGMMKRYPIQASWYDDIGIYFKGDTLAETCDNLYNFCEDNIRYVEEGEEWQSIALPNGILNKGVGDCKTYAGFIGGCLGAIARATGENIDWAFCFASYKFFRRTPYHVFVVVNTGDEQIWIDPTPGVDGKKPVWYTTKKPYEHMALMAQIAGVSVDGAGRLVYEQGAMGAIAPGSNVPSSALPLPDGYPANLPRPAIVNGKLQFEGLPPNFTPTDEQLAWMLIALQLWIYVYADKPYNVFQYNTVFDGSGLFLSDFITRFVMYHRNPDFYKDGEYGWYQEMQSQGPKSAHPQNWVQFTPLIPGPTGNDPKHYQQEAQWGLAMDDFDFANPPATAQHSWVDDIGTAFRVLNTMVMKYVAQFFPVVGTLFANAWNNAVNGPGGTAAQQQNTIDQTAGQIVQQIKTNTAAADKSKKLKMAVGIAAAILIGWYIYENE